MRDVAMLNVDYCVVCGRQARVALRVKFKLESAPKCVSRWTSIALHLTIYHGDDEQFHYS